jgi:hypothetical protein
LLKKAAPACPRRAREARYWRANGIKTSITVSLRADRHQIRAGYQAGFNSFA